MFYLAAAIYAVGAGVFVIFGSGERQSWAGDEDDKRPEELEDFLSENKQQTDKQQSDDATAQQSSTQFD